MSASESIRCFILSRTDLSEVIALAQQGKIKHTLKKVRCDDINEALEQLRDGDVIGRTVVTF